MDQYRRFDEAYYHRFYENPKTRIYGAKEHANLAQYVFSFARWNDIRVQSVLDIGAGIGLWKNWIAKNAKEVEYTGTEVSQAMCKKHGYQHRDIARWRDRRKYDLIICQGVLQYLSDPDVAPAWPTSPPWRVAWCTSRCSRAAICASAQTSSLHGHRRFVRNGSYYRGLFAKHLLPIGGGLHWTREVPPPFWELDIAGGK